VRTLEQLVNFRARYAEALHSSGATSPKPADLIREAEKLSNLLLQLGETAERWSIRGSLYKRAAVVTSGAAARRRSLERMEEAYRKGLEIARGRESRDVSYPLLNWYASQIALGWTQAPAKEVKAQIDAAAAELRTRADSLDDDECTFWDLSLKANVRLLDALHDGSLAKQQDAVFAAYEKAMRRGVSRREELSVLENLRFFETIAGGIAKQAATGKLLSEMREKLDAPV
jgi:hypothetical protein